MADHLSTQEGNIGLFGGSFDPVHFGHINLAIEMIEKRFLSEVWFCPAALSPFKQNSEQPVSGHHRLEMLKLALESIPQCSIIDIELLRQPPSYTIETIEALEEKMKDRSDRYRLHLIIGDDAIAGLNDWYRISDIIKKATLLVGKRLSINELIAFKDPLLREAIQRGMTETRRMEISSTDVRERLRQGLCCEHLIPQKVLDYIERHHLY
jgi:nicotinate-nucleotide adenylyltransferase